MTIRVIKTWTAVVLFLCFTTPFADAKDRVVMSGGLGLDTTSRQHMEKVYQIEYGTTLVFKSILGTKSFRVGKLLGQGYTTNVYELLDHPDKVIRIASDHEWDWPIRYFKNSWINATIKGYSSLKKAGIPIADIRDYRYDQYVVIDRVHGFTLEHYFLNSSEFSEAEREKIENDLVLFGKKTVHLQHIDDFKPEQLMYDKKRGWVLIDWTWGVHPVKNEHTTVFDELWELFQEEKHPEKKFLDFAAKVLTKVGEAILLERKIEQQSQCRFLFH